MALAVPAVLLALALAAFFDRYTVEFEEALSALFAADWQAFVGVRWPEAVGMLVGQALLLAILLFAGGHTLKEKLELN